MSKEKDNRIAEITADFKNRLERHIDDIVADENFIPKLAESYQKRHHDIDGLYEILMKSIE